MNKYRVRQLNPKEFVVETYMFSYNDDDGNKIYDWYFVDKWGFVSNCFNSCCAMSKEDAVEFAKYLAENQADKIVYESE